jgi:Flp pilus assembly protein TadD
MSDMEPIYEPLSYAPPLDRGQLLRDIEAAVGAQNLQRAAKLARQGLAAGFEHPGLLTLAAHESQGAGRTEEALGLLERARTLAPEDVNVLNALGFCLAAAGRDEEALGAYGQAVAAEPRFAPPHAGKAVVHEKLGQLDQAIFHYEQAVKLGLRDPEAIARRAFLAADQGDAATARTWAERALAIDPAEAIARMALAKSQVLTGAFAEARATIDASPVASWGPANRALALGILGDAYDGENDVAEAYQSFAGANKEMARLFVEEYALRQTHNPGEFLARLTDWFAAAKPADWKPAAVKPVAGAPAVHVFLVGYPRSGTTLLEQVLAAHPNAVSLEEQPALVDAEDAFFVPADGIDRLAKLSAAEIARFRDLYWARVRGFGVEPAGKVFIDKLPLNTVLIPAIARLFPDAKILFARRDPRDIVLSCFRQRFAATPAMFHFLTLEGTAHHYGVLMRLAETYRAALPLDLREVRHEDVVADLEGEMTEVCRFLGIDWDPAMADFAACRKGAINTPSAAQLAGGLRNDGVGQWRRYREQLTPVILGLEPWVEKFGYTPTKDS